MTALLEHCCVGLILLSGVAFALRHLGNRGRWWL